MKEVYFCRGLSEGRLARSYPPYGHIKVGAGGNKLTASHRVDNFPGLKLPGVTKDELKIVICLFHPFA